MAGTDDLRHSKTPAPTSGVQGIPIPFASSNASDTQAKISALVAAIAEKEKERSVYNSGSNHLPPTSTPNPCPPSGSFTALLRSIQAMDGSQSLNPEPPLVASTPIAQLRERLIPVMLKNAQSRFGLDDKSLPQYETKLREQLTDEVCRTLGEKLETAKRKLSTNHEIVKDPRRDSTSALQSAIIGSTLNRSLSDIGLPTPPASAHLEDPQDLPKAPRAMRLGQLAREQTLNSPTSSLPSISNVAVSSRPPRPDSGDTKNLRRFPREEVSTLPVQIGHDRRGVGPVQSIAGLLPGGMKGPPLLHRWRAAVLALPHLVLIALVDLQCEDRTPLLLSHILVARYLPHLVLIAADDPQCEDRTPLLLSHVLVAR
ncbi:hypothetical protein H0H92_014223 [Tricholoma furcatifolium]|nr:hypothetical protein H0H92_014223 [Tricholoma furcatifolium]